MISDDVIKSIIAIVPAIVTTIFGGFISVWMFKLSRGQEKIHTLVNSGHGLLLKQNAKNARWRADKEGNPEDIKAADEAEALLKEHEKAQAKVDAGNTDKPRYTF